MEIWWGREWKAVSKVWNWEWCKDGECAWARIGRQGENAVHLMRWTNSLWAWTGLVQIWTVAKLKNSVLYAQVSLKARQAFLHGFGRRWRTWRWKKDKQPSAQTCYRLGLCKSILENPKMINICMVKTWDGQEDISKGLRRSMFGLVSSS